MLELTEKFVDLVGSKSALTLNPLPQDNPRQQCADISFAKKNQGWKQKTDLVTGLKQTIACFEDLLRSE